MADTLAGELSEARLNARGIKDVNAFMEVKRRRATSFE